ncbi:MAG: polysaccharide biosynthesis tyrosine autokinase [Pseudomonadota bacterium]|nr:polysaccharide biosynthesis tyrosine autokinase [Pseudomonadota bacterium]
MTAGDAATPPAANSRSGLVEYAAGNTNSPALAPAQAAGFNPNEIIRIILKWRILIASALVAGPVLALLFSLLVTPLYTATTTIEINPDENQATKVGTDSQPLMINNSKFFATQYGLLQSESLAARVVDAQHLATNAQFVSQSGTIDARRTAATSKVKNSLKIDPIRDSQLVDIGFTSPHPAIAAAVASSVADEFIASNLERRFDATAYARTFLQQRLATTKTKLEQSERALVQYAQQQGIIDLNTGKDGSGQSSLDADSLVAVNAALIQAHTDRIAAEAKYRESARNGLSTDMMTNQTVQTLEAQRAQAQADYQDKLSTFLPQLPAMVALRARIDSLTRAIAGAKSDVGGAVKSDFAAAVQRENALQARVTQLRASVLNLRDRSINYTILQREVDTNRALYDALLQRFKEVGVAAGVGENLVSIVDRPKVPTSPVSPNILFNVMIGLLAGALGGFGVAFLIEFIDDTIKTPDDITSKLGLAALGVVPVGKPGETIDSSLADPRSEVTEAYYSIRAALQFATGHGVPKTLLVSSSRAGEGKSSTVLALAVSFARLGKRVLVIDADLRKPAFKVPKRVREGLTNLLSGAENTSNDVLETSVPNLFLMPSGPRVPNPAELLGTTRFRAILDEVSQYFDLVIVDGPPVLGLADAPLLGSVCEAAVLVIETANIRRQVAANTVARLRASNTRLLGAILNKYNPKRAGYGYGYGYGEGAYTYGAGENDAEDSKRQIELLK